MGKYLTPAVFRAMGSGFPLATVPDADIDGWIDAAESRMDSLAHFNEQNSLGFALGTRTEAHLWDPETRRIGPFSLPVPIRSVTSLTIQYGQSPADGSPESATIPANQVIVNSDDGYLEVDTLAVVLSGIAPVLAFTGVIAPIARLTYVAGYTVQKTNWRLRQTGAYLAGGTPPVDADPAAAVAWHSRLPAWDAAQPVSVSVGGAVQDPATYTANYLDGSVVFAAPVAPSSLVQATFVHTIPDPIVGIAYDATIEVANEYLLRGLGMYGTSVVKTYTQEIERRPFVDPHHWSGRLAAFLGPAVALA